MSDWKPRTDLNPDHYQFRRNCPGFYVPRETHNDKLGDRVVTIVSILVIALIAFGIFNG